MPVWEIQGAMKTTGEDVTKSVGGETEAEVRTWAKGQGILVHSVRPERPASGSTLANRQLEVLITMNKSVQAIHFWVRLAGSLMILTLVGLILEAISRR